MKGTDMLSSDALRVLAELFGPKSNLQLPAGWARVVIEIEQWAAAHLAEQSQGSKSQSSSTGSSSDGKVG